jgi:hypothetical protein
VLIGQHGLVMVRDQCSQQCHQLFHQHVITPVGWMQGLFVSELCVVALSGSTCTVCAAAYLGFNLVVEHCCI